MAPPTPSGDGVPELLDSYCFHCGKADPIPDHFCEEWDCCLHGKCVEAFLRTPEGEVVTRHRHHIEVCVDGKNTILREEGQDA